MYSNFIFFITMNDTIWCTYLQVSFRFVKSFLATARRALRGSTPNRLAIIYYSVNE